MQVSSCRLSWIWVEVVPGLLIAPAPAAPLGAIIDKDAYTALFQSLLQSDTHPLVTYPWPARSGPIDSPRNRYWYNAVLRRLRGADAARIATSAWAAMLPLRRKDPPLRIATDRSFVEGWYHPHGAALSITACLSGNFDAAALKDAAWQLARAPLPVVFDSGPAEQQRLDAIAGRALAALRREAFGDLEEREPERPLCILTVVRAAPEAGDTEATTAALRQACIEAAGGDPSGPARVAESITTWPRGRLIWRPDRMLATHSGVHTLGCLHRNVVMGSLQVASLLAACDAVLDVIDNANNKIPPRLDSFARAVAGLIGRIKGGVDTYAQACLADQIEAADQGGRISRLRASLGMSPLAPHAP